MVKWKTVLDYTLSTELVCCSDAFAERYRRNVTGAIFQLGCLLRAHLAPKRNVHRTRKFGEQNSYGNSRP